MIDKKDIKLWDLYDEWSIPYRKIKKLDAWVNIPGWRYKMKKENGFFQKVYIENNIKK